MDGQLADLDNFFRMQPLLHAIVFSLELAFAMRFFARFESYFAERPGEFPAYRNFFVNPTQT